MFSPVGESTQKQIQFTNTLGKAELKGLYTLGDVFVLPTRGEGAGLPFIEALSSGVPVIATGWGGHMDAKMSWDRAGVSLKKAIEKVINL